MSIKSNHFYHDPAMAQAAANLSDLFAPPSGSDASGYASARQTDLETNQRQAIWDYMQRPDADKTLMDRAGIIADLYDPSQSYYAVDTGAATQRYGYDTQAATSRSNNEADNIRAAADTAANNRRAALVATHGNLAPGEIRPGWTEEEAAILGIPAMGQVAGTTKPLSETEVKGGLLQAMASGKTQDIADELLVKQALLGTDVTETIDPLTRQPVLKNRFEAAGAAPVLSAEQEKGRVFASLPEEQKKQSVVDIKGSDTYHAVDAKGNERSFVGYIGSDGRIYDQAEPLKPAEGVVSKGSGGNQFAVDFNPDGTVAGIRQGAGVAGKAATDFQTKAGFASEMMEKPTKIILDAFDTGKTPTNEDIAAFQVINKMATSDSFAMAAALPYMNQLLTNEGQTFFAAMQQALPYELMVRSGQAVTEGEYARKLIAMIPLSNDNSATKGIKRDAFDTAQKAILRIAGSARKPDAASSQTPAAATATPPPAAAAPAAAADTEEEYVRDPVTKKLVRKK